MAKLTIRGRREPLEIENARAQVIKNKKFGLNGEKKVENSDFVDLGEWSGEYGRIVEIEMSSKSVTPKDSHEEGEKEYRRSVEKTFSMSPEARGQQVGRFNLIYAGRTGRYDEYPSKEIQQQAIEIQTKFFRENRNTLFCPKDLFEHLLPKKTSSNTPSVIEKITA